MLINDHVRPKRCLGRMSNDKTVMQGFKWSTDTTITFSLFTLTGNDVQPGDSDGAR